MRPEPEALLRQARYYLGHIDLAAEEAVFHEVPRDALRSHVHFAHRRFAPIRVELEALLAAYGREPLASVTPRFLFMTDWCGSTLLARALELLGSLSLYNEPFAFVALANQRRQGQGRSLERFARALELSKVLMARGYPGERGGLVKEQPATNLLMRELLSEPRPARGVFLFDTLPNYLASMLRDGWRREYTRERVQSYVELDRSELLDGHALAELQLDDAEIGAVHFLQQLATVAAVLQARPPGPWLLLRASELFGALRDAIARAASALELDYDQPALDRLLQSDVLTQHSKEAQRAFDVSARARALAAARAEHRAEIDRGLAWAARALERLPALQAFAADIAG